MFTSEQKADLSKIRQVEKFGIVAIWMVVVITVVAAVLFGWVIPEMIMPMMVIGPVIAFTASLMWQKYCLIRQCRVVDNYDALGY